MQLLAKALAAALCAPQCMREGEEKSYKQREWMLAKQSHGSTVHVHCSTAGYLRFHHMAQCVAHALKGMACRARVTPASSPSLHARLLLAHAKVTATELKGHNGVKT